jgi:hypothetical protein
MKHINSENSTFQGGEPTWANACVGDNGNPQIFEYASGFASAANVLLSEVIKREGFDFYVDFYVYPICFNMRHAVELFLKGVVENLVQLANIRDVKIPELNVSKSHDLGRIWAYVKENSVAADERYSSVINALDEYVVDIARIDSTGQVFRYPFDVDNKKHLTDLAVVNLILLKKRFNALESQLKELNRLSEALLSEYRWGTFTAHLSRAQLVEMALALPRRDQWGAGFDDVKNKLKNKYKISSRELSEALKLIQKRHEIAAFIDVVVEIPEVNFQTLKIFIDNWLKMHDIEEIKNPSDLDFEPFDQEEFTFEKMIKWHEKKEESCDTLMEAMSPECFASIRTLFNFYRESPYSEVFDKLLVIYRGEAERYLEHPNEYKRSAMHLLEKTNAFEGILNSLNFVGQEDLVDSVFSEYGLNEAKARLLETSETLKKRLKEGGRI